LQFFERGIALQANPNGELCGLQTEIFST